MAYYYAEDLLSESDRKRFEKHLDDCKECKKYLKDYKKINSFINKTVPAEIKSDTGDLNRFVYNINMLTPHKDEKNSYIPFRQLGIAFASIALIVSLLIYFNTSQKFKVLTVTGEVYFQKGNKKVILTKNQKLHSGHHLITGKNSECYLSYGDNIICLNGSSRLFLKSIRRKFKGAKITLGLEKGRLYCNIRDRKAISKMVIKSGEIETLVTGTILMVENYSDMKKVVSVLKGNVRVKSELSEVPVNSNKKLIFEKKNKPLQQSLSEVDKEKFSKILKLDLYYKCRWEYALEDSKGIKIVEEENIIYLVSEEGNITALDKNNGNKLWDVKIQGKISAAPAYYNDTLYINSSDGYIYAVSNSEIKWRKNYGPFSYSAPLIHNRRLYLANTKGQIYSVSLEDKKIIWQSSLNSPVFSTPVIINDKLYIGTISGQFYSINSGNGNILWQENLEGRIIDNPAVFSSGALYVGTSSGYIYKVLASNGDIVWQKNVGGPIDSPIINNGDIFYVKTEKLFAFDINGRELWHRELKGESQLYIANDNIVINDDNIFVINSANGLVEMFYSKPLETEITYINNEIFACSKNNLKLLYN